MKIYYILLNIVFLVATTFHSSPLKAQEIERIAATDNSNRYKEATMENLSQLYWALDRLDPENEIEVTNYLMINQCEIYAEYRYNEFQWGNIKRFAKQYVKENTEKFPIRFKFVQPLRLGSYDFEKEAFNIDKGYEIDGIRRFEIEAVDEEKDVCGFKSSKEIQGYPKGILLELSRPVFLKTLPMHMRFANEYINEKTTEFKRLSPAQRKFANAYNFRDIYLVFNVRFFGAGGDFYSKRLRRPLATTMGVLESLEIYDDKNLERLLHKEDFSRKKREQRRQLISQKRALKAAQEQAKKDAIERQKQKDREDSITQNQEMPDMSKIKQMR